MSTAWPSSALDALALTPPCCLDPSLAIAASRAGATGVLNLEGVDDAAAARGALERLQAHARGVVGVRLEPAQVPWLSPADSLDVALLTGTDPAALPDLVVALRRHARRVLFECTSRAAAPAALAAGVDGLVAKGNEAGGFVGETSTLILLQQLTRDTPWVWAHGVLGPHGAAACRAAGARGVVLEGALALTPESPLPPPVRARLAGLDGTETVCLGLDLAMPIRGLARPGAAVLAELRGLEQALAGAPDPTAARAAWATAVRRRLGWADTPAGLWPVGQDAALAAALARTHGNVAGILRAVATAVHESPRRARAARPLDVGAPLAVAHGTRYPIVQGPMTRVSDGAAFADAVATGGALPLIALALMPGPEVRTLLREVRTRLAGRPWGVGILGFVPPDVRHAQLEALQDSRPPFALIAGGRPDQASQLEAAGTRTYLHVPSPGLLRLFLAEGARRFVLEGRECGGHVGPLGSLALWELAVETLLEAGSPSTLADVHLLFAGGIHDGASAAAAAVLAGPLLERGVRIGVLVGTAYLFTEEAVGTGAVRPGFQAEAIGCERTVLLETGPGHATRCAASPFVARFRAERRRLEAMGAPAEEVRRRLEALNLGRLRVATKGLARQGDGAPPPLVTVPDAEQRREGLFMLGQVALLRNARTTIAVLHADVSAGGTDRIAASTADAVAPPAPAHPAPLDLAIVGMSCLVPGAADLAAFWRNVLTKASAIAEVPAERWDWRRYFDPAVGPGDRTPSRWGGFLPDVPFDPVSFGIAPNSLGSIEPVQLLTLLAVRAALADAGYQTRPFDRERTAVIVGTGGGGDLAQLYGFRALLPTLLGDASGGVLSALDPRLPRWTEDSFPGILPNVTAGRVANRFDLGGPNYTVDAACASSLAALSAAARELQSGSSDVAVVAGADTLQGPFAFLCFANTHALSPTGQCRPFDADADGIAISEGIAVAVLKRLPDAERDGDRIYAVVRGLGAASDGRDRSLTAPSAEGQLRALRRAYAQAGISPASVGLVEAHGTGTVAGDRAELLALTRLFEEAGARPRSCALGSVKSMVGHTKNAAGLVGLIKTALALYHRALPPTLGVTRPTPGTRLADAGPLYVNTEARPWCAPSGALRRAGVSAFGFGGTNFHAVLEEHGGEYRPRPTAEGLAGRTAELLVWRGEDRDALDRRLARVLAELEAEPEVRLVDRAAATWFEGAGEAPPAIALTIVAGSRDDLRGKLHAARAHLRDASTARLWDPRGVYLAFNPTRERPRVAFLFPGQGSQSVDMLRELALAFPGPREAFELADAVLGETIPGGLSALVFPPPAFGPADSAAHEQALAAPRVAQPAIAAASLGILHLLERFGIRPDCTAGHSFGEYTALHAAGVLAGADLLRLAEARGRLMAEAAGADAGGMAAVDADAASVVEALAGQDGLVVANDNGPRQVVIAGPRAALETAIPRLAARGLTAHRLRVGAAFHSPLVAGCQAPLARLLAALPLTAPRLPVYSATTAAPYAGEPARIAAALVDHVVRPVRFRELVLALHADGVRVFLEVGPRNVLTALVGQTLDGMPHLAVAAEQAGRPGAVHWLHVLGQLAASGVPVDGGRLFEGLAAGSAHASREPAAAPWLVSGGRVRPATESAAGPAPATSAPPASAPPVDTLIDRAIAAAAGGPGLAALAPASAPADAGPDADETHRVMREFHRTMDRFLQLQERVMLTYLGRAPAPPGGIMASVAAPVDATEPSPGALRPPESAAAGDAPPEPDETPTPEVVRRRLLAIVGERTGYPLEALAGELDLEADLGIDSIKRVEILGTYRRRYGAQAGGDMDRLSTLRTLDALAARLATTPGAGEEAGPAPGPPASRPRPPERSVWQPVAPAPIRGARPLAGAVLVTEDSAGVAARLVERLAAGGHPVALVRDGDGPDTGPHELRGDLDSEEGVETLLARARAGLGPIAALVYLRALGRLDELDGGVTAARAAVGRDARTLFLLARAVQRDLTEAAGRGGACLLVATSAPPEGGSAGVEPAGAQAAPAGFAKALAREWPAVRVRVVADDGAEPAGPRAERLAQELLADADEIQVAYRAGARLAFRAVPAPLAPDGPVRLTPDPSWVILLTGGARGITAAVAGDLAARYRPTLVLVGRTPLGTADPHAGLAGPALRQALLEEARHTGRPDLLATTEAEARRLEREREIRRTLEGVRAAGARAEYFAVDARDPTAVRALVDRVRRTYGRLDAVIHGAGLIEDARLGDKTLASFDRVFGSKVHGALALIDALDPATLRLLVFFASIAGRLGNRGQADYAAANEALTGLAAELDRRWPTRVVSISWGPWAGGGMVSTEVAAELTRAGMPLLAPEEGCRAFDAEITRGGKGEAAVVLATGELLNAGALARPADATERAGAGFALTTSESSTNGAVAIERDLDPVGDPFLRDHVIAGRAVLPLAVAAELIAEAATRAAPGLEPLALHDLRVLRGVTLDGERQRVRVIARPRPTSSAGRAVVDVSLVDPDTRPLYRARVELGQAAPTDGPTLVPLPAAGAAPPAAAAVYREWLFHGPAFRCLLEVERVGPDGLVAWLARIPREQLLGPGTQGAWQLEPGAIDAVMQLVTVWGRAGGYRTGVAIPNGFRRYRRLGVPGAEPLRCGLLVHAEPAAPLVSADAYLHDGAGRLFGVLEGIELVFSEQVQPASAADLA